MKGFTFILALVFGIQVIHGAEILRGYMLSKDGSVCINTDDATGVVDSTAATGRTANELGNANCTLMSVKDGANASQYTVESQTEASKELILTSDSATTFGAMGTQLTFTPEGTTTPLTGITSAGVSDLTTMGTSLYVADVSDQTNNTDCLRLNGTYLQGDNVADCADQLWYFVKDTCIVANCQACSADQAICTQCAADRGVNTNGTECVACNGVTNCETCSLNSTDDIVCKSCGSDKYPTSGGASCGDCDTIISGCSNCSVSDGTTQCTVCNGTQFPTSGGSGCDECGNVISDCSTCSLSNGVTSCTTCGNDKDRASDGSACETTTTESSAVVEKASVMAMIGMASLLLNIL